MRSSDALEVQQLLDARPAPSRSAPMQFAVAASAGWTLADGQWRSEGTDRIWELRLFSAGAKNLNLALDQLQLPPSAQLRFSDVSGEIQHWRSAADVIDGQLWTPVVPGDTALLQVRLRAEEQHALQLRVAQLNHGFWNFWDDAPSAKNHDAGLGASGDCNVDTACPAGAQWGDQIRSVARITVNGQALCSGQLVNNLGSTALHYFLTANHCEIGPGGSAASSLVFYWNMETPSCGGNPETTPITDTSSGARYISRGSRGDYTLLCLDSPALASYNLFLSGWDAGTGETPTNGVSIHHPSGDAKKISSFSGAATARNGQEISTGSSTFVIDAWEVSWEQGTTERGSSGSGLWSVDGQLMGLLSGGDAACSGSTNNGQPDYYARFDVAWREGSSGQQLRNFLDPNNSGQTATLGRNSGNFIPACPGSGNSGGGTSGSSGGNFGGGPFTALGLLTAWALRRRVAPRASS